MKKLLILFPLLICVAVLALPVNADADDKNLSAIYQEAGSLRMQISNLGYVADLTEFSLGNKFLYKGSSWISAKKYRRDAAGRLLYWKVFPPSAVNDTIVYEGHPDWQPGMVIVTDSLTTVGFDGDLDLMEFLPAYNPLNSYLTNPDIAAQDLMLRSILGNPAPRPFVNPDPEGTYCFSIPQGGTFDTPGFETLSGYYYDYCPFDSPGDRDWGASRGVNSHYPLGLAVHRESYAWPLQNHDRMIIIKNTLVNSSEIDTLFDLAVAELVDADLGPISWGVEAAVDDVSGYVKGPGYEFAYTRDQDGDGGLSTHLLAHKLIIPQYFGNRQAWFWQVGHGPDDRNPRNLQPPGQTANEKYWLCTGRNPNSAFYAPLRPWDPDVMEYEQPTPHDTRFLISLFGSVPPVPIPDPIGRLHLAPQEAIVYYSVYYTGDSIDDLKVRSQAIEDFIATGFNLGDLTGDTCIPYLMEPQAVYPSAINLQWHSYTNPDHFDVMIKEYDSPASTWLIMEVPGDWRSYSFSSLDPTRWYELKVGAAYYPATTEVYLESSTYLININNALDSEDPLQPPVPLIKVFPNPFVQSTDIQMQMKEPGKALVEVYNLRGQKIKTIIDANLSAGEHLLSWDGRDEQGRSCSSGVYFLKLSHGGVVTSSKMLLLK